MPFTNNTEEDWDRAFAVNTKSVFLSCKGIAPYFIERKAGRIINIASIAGPLAAITMPPYSVAKQGVITFTRVIAKELEEVKKDFGDGRRTEIVDEGVELSIEDLIADEDVGTPPAF